MKSVPRFMQGPYRIAMRVVLEELNSIEEVRVEKGWKLFLLLPRLLLFQAPRDGLIPRPKLMSRLELFNRGCWRELLEASRSFCHQATVLRCRETGDRKMTLCDDSAVQNLSCTWESCRPQDKP